MRSRVPDGAPAAARAAWRLPALLPGVVSGAALQLLQPRLWPPLVYGALLCAALALGWYAGAAATRRRHAALWAAAPALLAAGLAAAAMFAVCGLRAWGYMEQALAPALEGQDIRVTGLVAAMPQASETGTRLRLEVDSALLRGQAVRLPPRIEVGWYGAGFGDANADAGQAPGLRGRPPVVRAGERWALTVRLKAPHGMRNPHGFDYELWLWEQGVQATGYVRTGPKDAPPLRLGATWRHPVERWRQSVRDAIVERLGRGAQDSSEPFRARIAGVVAALVTGDQRAIERADWELFRATGVAHLMSISGLHITLFAWLAALAVRTLWRRSTGLCLAVPAPSAALVAGVLLAAGYALFSGWGVPAQRTVIMLGSVACLQLSGRRWPWPQVWLLACAAVVLADPWALAQAGFWLSFVAVGVLFATNPTVDDSYRLGAMGRFHALLREQWVVTLALTPLTLLLFAQLTLVGFAANLVAIPWVTLVVTPLALAGLLWAPLWSLAALALQPLIALLQWLAQWPWAQLFLPAAPLWAGGAAVAGGALLALRMPWQLRLPALALLVPVLWWQPQRPAPGQFELLAADIGQGNAVLVRTANHTLLYDAGPRFGRDSDAGQRVLVPLLRARGERLDLLMLSHPDADHTGGAAAVLAQQPQARLTGSIDASHAALHGLRPVQPCLAGQRWQWDGVAFEVLHPLAGPVGKTGGTGAAGETGPAPRAPTSRTPASNASSCVLRIAANAASTANGASGAERPDPPVALLAGDIEAPQEQALVARGAPLRADLLLVPHHGSKTSSTPAFLEAVRPRTALVQAGYRNRFGHPAPEVLQRYRERNIRVLESARCGAATWSSAQPGRVACERDTDGRYWQHRLPPRGAGRDAR
ncbi:DNA internalization-related competence protein ComEC/Rec2 [Verminephrobacter eiseniae]|nr:DNA internalization-related competence protein ComEC/Rec2 [Verminephrobacter eiseniae]MCW5286562.1 DNA internalization-related competence protein ComEC/Rec2 [Verminephrobacter eiseniae]MCW5304861.1 DNA internalization-related competence protein ComEC/Rec2 [Verminephrobacter eiseniae]MCW8178307.1 DNA internalization-related competence protein ComEC/Rec2 [Verminephrobacter eiseniae]MCW8190031.1 DNA internalization-related competence protein ComEC/Rec2 [Verminephrobacter eiseniae]